MDPEQAYKHYYKQFYKDMVRTKMMRDPYMGSPWGMGMGYRHMGSWYNPRYARCGGFWGPFIGVIAGCWVYHAFSETHKRREQMRDHYFDRIDKVDKMERFDQMNKMDRMNIMDKL